MAIIVVLDEKDWLVDVGFGDGIINPIEISIGKVQMDYHRYWKIDTDADEQLILKESPDTNFFSSRYRFSKKY